MTPPQRLYGRVLRVAPDALALARGLRALGLPMVALLHSQDRRQRYSYVGADPDRLSHAIDPVVDDDGSAQVSGLAKVPRWIGILPYECRRDLERPAWTLPDRRPEPLCVRPEWWRYRAVLRVDATTGEVLVVGDDEGALRRLVGATLQAKPVSAGALTVRVDEASEQAEHLERVAHARRLILEGQLYQVNLARRLGVEVEGEALDLYERMALAAPASFGAVLPLSDQRQVISTSPELLLRADVRALTPGERWPRFSRLITEPVKGTRPRGDEAGADARLAVELENDEKERAELAMIIDVERNDLARVSLAGTVRIIRPPAVHTFRSLHHRRATLAAVARPDVSRREVLASMVPSGSVTGAPKVRAMELIARLERDRRGLYTGGFGYIAHDGSVQLAMAIRTLVLQGAAGHYWTGGGIVVDSIPEAELDETRWKARQLLDAS